MTQLNNILKNLNSDSVQFNEDKQVFTITHADGSVKTIPLKDAVSEDLLQALEGPIDDPKQQLIDKYTKRLTKTLADGGEFGILKTMTPEEIKLTVENVVKNNSTGIADFLLTELTTITEHMFDPTSALAVSSEETAKQMCEDFALKYELKFGELTESTKRRFNSLIGRLWSDIVKPGYYAHDADSLNYCLNEIAKTAKLKGNSRAAYNVKIEQLDDGIETSTAVEINAINGSLLFDTLVLFDKLSAEMTTPVMLLHDVILPFREFINVKPRPVPEDKQTIVSFARRLISEGCPLNHEQRRVFENVINEPSGAEALKRKRPQMGLGIGQRIIP